MQSASDTPSSHLWALWRSAVWSAAATAGRPGLNKLSPSAGRKGDWDVPFRIPSTATLRHGGAAWATGGLSLLYDQLVKRLTTFSNPCDAVMRKGEHQGE
ncbi:MAG: hypothetical protein U9Q81_07740 [Pseudomonadota bacterium]|nr:hypothetical protein [Pseudomonadota bacterium]